jgi:hypothetical protein
MVPPVVVPKKESMQTLYDLEHDKSTLNPKPKLLKFTNNDPRNDLTSNAKISITENPNSTIKEVKKNSTKGLSNKSLVPPLTVNDEKQNQIDRINSEGIKQNPNNSNKQLPNNI